jgi:hypothetical protein
MRTTACLLCALLLGILGCPTGDDDDTTADEVEILDPEPAGAPTGVVDGRLSCLGDNAPPAPIGGAVELTGYARTLADATAEDEPPEFEVEVVSASGTTLETVVSNVGNDGRVTVTVPIPDTGFEGWAMITADTYVDLRFQSSRPTTDTASSGWAWLATQAELDDAAANLGQTLDSGGVLVGASHDCDGFGMENVVIVVDGDAEAAYYVEGFSAVDTRTFSATNGRFAVPNVGPGAVVVKAFGRLEAGGPLTLLSSISTSVAAGGMTAVALEPRVGLE